MIAATQARELFCKKILIENHDVFSQIDFLISQAIINGNSKIIIKYTDNLSKDINDNILEVLKIYGYEVNYYYIQKLHPLCNGCIHPSDIPAGYVISWKV